MKHRATIDLEFTNGDLFEQEFAAAVRKLIFDADPGVQLPF